MILVLTILVAQTVQDLLAVPLMPQEMECFLKHNCMHADPVPVAPLIAPRLSDLPFWGEKVASIAVLPSWFRRVGSTP